MHACNTLTLNQLLSLRDGTLVDSSAMLHVERCAECASEIERLRAVADALKSLPMLSAPPYNAAGIRARMHAVKTYRAARIAAAAGICALTLVLITAVNGVRAPSAWQNNSPEVIANVAAESAASLADEENVNALVIRSQELESYLQRLPRRPHIERASTSTTIDSLQSRIQWVDYQLSLSHDVGMTDSQSAELWANRVQLMDSLLKVRYAEAQRTAAISTSLPRSAL